MPGHKRNVSPFPYLANLSAKQDITEIAGFDNLHDPHGILKQSMKRAACLRGASRAFYLINGTTCGILAAITACVPHGGKLIMARNCHKSVYNAAELIDADTVYILPDTEPVTGGYGCITPESVGKAVKENPDAKLLVITDPTYEGIINNMTEICKIAHNAGIPVLADAAHGAHLGFGSFPKGAFECGADISVESLHKTLPSLTQTAICYVSDSLVNPEHIAQKLSVFETSSPSYLLLASIDGCVRHIENANSFSEWQSALDGFYHSAENFKNITILGSKPHRFYDYDKSKIVITHAHASGKELFYYIYRRGTECEMFSARHCIAMTGMGDTPQSLAALTDILKSADSELSGTSPNHTLYPPLPHKAISAHSASELPAESVHAKMSTGRICAEYVWAYPPGIPILIPGETVTPDAVELFSNYTENGVNLSLKKPNFISVLKTM